jgi:hypothetical protein
MFHNELSHLRSFAGRKGFELLDDFSRAHVGKSIPLRKNQQSYRFYAFWIGGRTHHRAGFGGLAETFLSFNHE